MRLLRRVWINLQSFFDIAKEQGLITAFIRVLEKLQLHRGQSGGSGTAEGPDIVMPLIATGRSISLRVPWTEARQVDWKSQCYKPVRMPRPDNPRVAWIMPPPGKGGGHQNIFRFVDYLRADGMPNDIYLSSTVDHMSLAQARRNVAAYCQVDDLGFFRFTPGTHVDADVVFATGWETAYDLACLDSPALKYYFVQDFEPFFFPVGSNYVLSENTYRLGFPGITAGGWLAHKLSTEFGMTCHPYDFGADAGRYFVTNNGPRRSVMFYARPVTERRGFALGMLALEQFHELRPDIQIHLAGWDVRQWRIPFPYVHHGSMRLDQLNDLYNKCSAALVISLTNMSLLPLELLASGVVPVVTAGDNNSMVSNNENIRYCEITPAAMARALAEAVDMNDDSQMAARASASVPTDTWDKAGRMLIDVIRHDLKAYSD